jgi:hypothetical protein
MGRRMEKVRILGNVTVRVHGCIVDAIMIKGK